LDLRVEICYEDSKMIQLVTDTTGKGNGTLNLDILKDMQYLDVDPSRTYALKEYEMKKANAEKAKYTASAMGYPLLLDKHGYIFYLNTKREISNTSYWFCPEKAKNKCPAKAITKGPYVKEWIKEHNHEKKKEYTVDTLETALQKNQKRPEHQKNREKREIDIRNKWQQIGGFT